MRIFKDYFGELFPFSLFLSIFLLAGCAAATKDIRPLFEEQHAYGKSEQESRLISKSDRLHKKLVKKGMVVESSAGTPYLREISNSLNPLNGRNMDPVALYIIRDPSFNAFALPNGKIYINEGLVALLPSESELAFIIAHEIAHVVYRHGYRNASHSKNNMIALHLTDVLLGGTHLASYGFLANMASFSREQEQEADYAAIEYLQATSFPEAAAPKALESLQNISAVRNQGWLATHPDIAERILNARNSINDSQNSFDVNSPEFLSLKRLAFQNTANAYLAKGKGQLVLELVELNTDYIESENLALFEAEAKRQLVEQHASGLSQWEDSNAKEEFDAEQLLQESAAIYKELLDTSNRAKALRGLGFIARLEGRSQESVQYFKDYLSEATRASDKKFISKIIRDQENADS